MTVFTFRLWVVLLLGLLTTTARAQRLAAGTDYTLAIHADGTLWAWGQNTSGQLGLGQQAYQTTPQQVGAGADWQRVWAGYDHTVALRADGSLWAWGYNNVGQLGLGTTVQQLSPQRIGTATWRSASTGNQHTVAIRQDGTLWAWGYNGAGQLGTGAGSFTGQPTPTQVGTATNWASVSAGNGYTLALRTDGTLWAWGDNAAGQLGTGTTAQQLSPVQVGTATWLQVSAGPGHALAVRTDGTLWAWGDNTNGQLGLGTTTSQLSPVQVGTATTWVSAATGYRFSLGLRQGGTLWAWGLNRYGQLGLGTTAQQASPAQVGTATWASVAAGFAQAVALRPDNSCWAWGGNYIGQLGAGAGGPQLLPAPIDSAPTWRAVAVSFFQVLGIRTDGTLWAWGLNSNGQLGTDDQLDRDLPVPIGSGTTWQSATTSNLASLAIRQDGTLWAWGDNSYGQLGTGAALAYATPTPVQVGTATNWRSVSASGGHVLGIRTDGTLWAWGQNYYGQLGVGTTGPATVTSPVQVGTATNWQRVSAGVFHSAAIRTDGTLWTWGDNINGVLGNGPSGLVSQPTPAQVGTATNWASVSTSVLHNVALRQDGTLWTWGQNYNGQLGFATTAYYQATPAQVGTATTWASASAGPSASLARRQDGSLWVWGENGYGTLGLGTTTEVAAPVQQGTATWQSAALGTQYGAGIRADGTLYTWGYNNYGQLGNGLPGSPTPRYVPNGGAVLATSLAPAPTTWALAPNPAHGTAQVLGLPAGPVAARLFDAQGRLVRTTTSAAVDVSGLAPGLYLLRATAGAATRTLRLAVD